MRAHWRSKQRMGCSRPKTASFFVHSKAMHDFFEGLMLGHGKSFHAWDKWPLTWHHFSSKSDGPLISIFHREGNEARAQCYKIVQNPRLHWSRTCSKASKWFSEQALVKVNPAEEAGKVGKGKLSHRKSAASIRARRRVMLSSEFSRSLRLNWIPFH